MNEELVWDKIGENYKSEIFSVLHEDKNGVVKKSILKHKNKNKLSIDFGCGVGHALPFLSSSFKEVMALDISQKLLRQIRNRNYSNVSLKKVDLAKKKLKLPKADFAYCCNVAICDDNKKNYQILKNVLRSLKKNGTAIIILPSFESASNTLYQMIQLYEKDKIKINEIPKDELHPAQNTLKQISEGIHFIDNHPTKHYHLQELYTLFHHKNYSIESIRKVEYNWKTEITNPPKYLKEPFPWDWLVEVKRIN